MKNIYTLIILFCVFSTQLFAQSDQYLHFDRANKDHVLTPNGSDLVLGNQISMTGWFYTDELVYGQGMMGFRSGTNGFYLIQLDNGIIECRLNTNAGLDEYVAPAFTVIPEQWQHFAWIFDGTSVSLYVDGVYHGGAPANGNIIETGVPFTVGRSILSNLDFYYGGRVDEITLWSKALTEEEINDLMQNELVGDEENLQIYYKFNQGVPGADNSSITHTVCEINSPDTDGELINFILTGDESNFNGDFDASFQAISFPTIVTKLTTDAPFDLTAEASSGLPIEYTLVSGPASISGNTVTLDGTAGTVTIEANQSGDGTFSAADPVQASFDVVDPNENTPNIRITNPATNTLVIDEVGPIHLAAVVDIDYAELFSVGDVFFEIGDDIVPATFWKDGHYTAYWTPPSDGTHTINVKAFNNFDAFNIESNIVTMATDNIDVTSSAFEGIVINTAIAEQTVRAILPSYKGAYNQIIGTLDIQCPPGQPCGEWDRVGGVEIKTHEGEWIELIRYITPYSTACTSTIDLTDFMATLQGEVDFRVHCTTFDTGYSWNLSLEYIAGQPEYNYGFISPLWYDIYPFGDMANLQPVESVDFSFPENTEAATLKLVSSGHGWGDNNTGNAAEFHEDTHHILVNDAETFEQHNWNICNPNPDSCSPQNGTWFYNRAGWCPGAIAPFFDYNMAEFIGDNAINLKYRFDENYVDLCHPNAPGCTSGITCPDCDDGFNPNLHVASTLITFTNDPVISTTIVGINEDVLLNALSIYPNPSEGNVQLKLDKHILAETVSVRNVNGSTVYQNSNPNFTNGNFDIDLSNLPNGVYQITVTDSNQNKATKALLLNK